MLFFLDLLKLVVFDDNPERHPRSSFEGSLQLHLSSGLSEALGTGLSGMPRLNQ